MAVYAISPAVVLIPFARRVSALADADEFSTYGSGQAVLRSFVASLRLHVSHGDEMRFRKRLVLY